MKIRQIMDCSFTSCSVWDTVETIVAKMMQNKTSYAVVTDDENTYQGVVKAIDLLKARPDACAMQLVNKVEAVTEDDLIADLKQVDSDILPVVNYTGSVVGVISLRSALSYLPETLFSFDNNRQGAFRKTVQLTAKYSINDIIGQSKAILILKEQILAAAKTRSTVLILGETGTGKELAAHAIHRLSVRRHYSFVRVNCAAIPENLLESELFGYEPGAFTGAVKGGQTGKFEIADGGTIFLDEIGDMPMALQAKILRVLQEKEIEKVGGRAPIPVDVRIIAATHRNLRDLVKSNKFREDLYYRLHVIPIQMPPLRDHREDIPLLMEYFLAKQAKELAIPNPAVERDFITSLVEYDWPGNVRELANVMELAVSMSHGVITKKQLPGFMFAQHYSRHEEDDAAVLRDYAEEAEKDAIIKALEVYDGNKIKVAEALGISRSGLYNKLKKYNIDC